MDINDSAMNTLFLIIAFAIGIIAGWKFRDWRIKKKEKERIASLS